MAIVKSQNIRQITPGLDMRDARHAHNFFTSKSFEFAPKTKYLYHVVFSYTNEAQGKAVTSSAFNREMSMLVKSADLPGFTAEVDTKKQYNRVKHLQTGITYDPVTIRFHDDNKSISSKLFEEYYRYYFYDGNKFNINGRKIDFDPRDMYSERVPRYGMDGAPVNPFFNEIKIFQMSRQKYRAYTLVNPIVQRWQHDNVESSDASGMMENSMTVIYEGVLYSEGDVTLDSDPVGFGSQETLYDTFPSPLGNELNYPDLGEGILGTILGVLNPATRNQTFSNIASTIFNEAINPRQRDPGGYPNVFFPTRSTQVTASSLNNNASRPLDSSRIIQTLNQNPSAMNSFVNRAIMTGNVRGYSVNNFQDYQSLSPNTQSAIQSDLLKNVAGGDRRLQQIATQAINGASN